VVEHLTHIPKIRGSNQTFGTWKEKMAIIVIESKWLCPAGTMVKQLTHNPKSDSSNTTTGTVRENMARNVIELK
jgi:hypothetical protein